MLIPSNSKRQYIGEGITDSINRGAELFFIYVNKNIENYSLGHCSKTITSEVYSFSLENSKSFFMKFVCHPKQLKECLQNSIYLDIIQNFFFTYRILSHEHESEPRKIQNANKKFEF